MAFCIHCGQRLAEGAQFCANCGNAVSRGNSSTQRKTVYDGEIHKCPQCGEVLSSFVTNCPSCGYELRGAKSSNSIQEFFYKLVNAKTEEQRILLIRNFPIPNTKEDIFEFMFYASSNLDSFYYTTNLYKENLSHAWLTKIEQCYLKAKLSFGEHYDFKRIEELYFKIKADCIEKENKIKQEENAKKDAQKRAETEKDFKKSKLRIITIIFSVISALCIAVSFNDRKILSGIIAIVMFVSFVTTFLMGSGVIKEKIKNIRLLPLILAFILFIPYFATYSSSPILGDSTRWDDILLNEYAPKPIMTTAIVMENSREEFYIYNIKCSQSEFYDYVNACKEFGYDHEVIEEDAYSFEAYNKDGYQIKVSYITTLSVEVNIPMEMNSIEWPNSDIAKLIPQPKSLYGKIEWEHNYGFVIYIGNTTFAEYKKYVNSIYSSGFNLDYSKGNTSFRADNADGYHVTIDYEGFNTMFIRIDDPDEK